MDPHRQLDDDEQHLATETLRSGLAASGMDVEELWTAVIALGGGLGTGDVAEIVAGERPRTAHEHDLLAQALNDRFVAMGGDHPVRYSFDLS